MSSFLSELKRRNVFRVGFAYAAIGWLLVEIVSVVFPIFDAPKWVVQVFTTLVLLGFPLALVLSWAFELTADGFVRTADAPDSAPAARQAGRRLNTLMLVAIAAVAALLLLERFSRNDTLSNAPVASGDTVPEGVDSRTSIVVLPFVNLSSDPEQEYFSDGLTEELLDRLAQIHALRVPARTSSFHFKGNTDLQAVQQALGVQNILQGSVRKSGQMLRITAQLTDVRSGEAVLWSNTYERKLTEVFEVQDDITAQIVSALKLRLEGMSLPRAGAPIDPELYQLMLRGRFAWNQRTENGLARAVAIFQEASEKNPDYGPAYAGLADAYLSQFDYGLISLEESTARARAAATRALELDPMLAEAHTSLAHILLHEWQWQAADREFVRAIELDPNYVVARHWYALCLTALGRTDDAVETMEHAKELDPLSIRINADLGMAYLAAGRYDDAVAQEGRTLELQPNEATPKWIRGMALEQLGQFAAAETDMREVLDAWDRDATILGSLGHLLGVAGREDEARELLAEIVAQDETGDVAFFAALVDAGIGDNDEAFKWLDRAIDKRSGSVRYLKIEPRFRQLHDDPRYAGLLVRVGLPR